MNLHYGLYALLHLVFIFLYALRIGVSSTYIYIVSARAGPVDQLVDRPPCTREASGSNPDGSITEYG